jgi:hypothetical protein
MKVSLIKEKDNIIDIELDENDEFKELKCRQYQIMIESKKEHELIEFDLKNALIEGIEVYQYTLNASRLELFESKVFTVNVLVTILSTTDTTKFDILDEYVKNMMREVNLSTEE